MMNPRHPDRMSLWLSAALLALASMGSTAQTAPKPSSGDSAPAAASGKQSQEEPDTLILSDTLNYNDAAKESTFTGNVIMTRGLLTLRSDKLVMSEDAEGFQRSEEHTSELQSLMRISYAVFCLKKKQKNTHHLL